LSTIFLQAVNSYLGSHMPSQAAHNAAAVHGYATVFGICTLFFVGAAVLTGLLLPSGRLAVGEGTTPPIVA
jgi:hypothetical protein